MNKYEMEAVTQVKIDFIGLPNGVLLRSSSIQLNKIVLTEAIIDGEVVIGRVVNINNRPTCNEIFDALDEE
jgi:hypothetical protein